MLALDEYLKLRERPKGKAAMRQKWRDLVFLHVRLEPAIIQDLLPQGLEVDTYPDESGKEWAWLALVPFWMTDIRLPWMPFGFTFCETNVRTYVHRSGKEPGVWFFSLDASNRLACAYARRFFGLPYYFADMRVSRMGGDARYRLTRRWLDLYQSPIANAEGFSAHGYAAQEACDWFLDRSPAVDIVANLHGDLSESVPGTLDFFLIERYLLYAQTRKGLSTGRVWHPPYQVCSAQADGVHSMFSPLGLANDVEWDHVRFSPGVDVEVFALTVQP